MSDINSKLATEAAAVESVLAFTETAEGSVTGYTKAVVDAKIDVLIEAISYESTDPTYHRGSLDEMSPACRIQLYSELTALKAAFA